jgi:hypothetical protein
MTTDDQLRYRFEQLMHQTRHSTARLGDGYSSTKVDDMWVTFVEGAKVMKQIMTQEQMTGV